MKAIDIVDEGISFQELIDKGILTLEINPPLIDGINKGLELLKQFPSIIQMDRYNWLQTTEERILAKINNGTLKIDYVL